MAEIIFSKLKSEVLDKDFDCDNPSINQLVVQSYYPTLLQHAYAFQVSSGSLVLGYYMLKFMKIELDIAPEDISDYRSSICDDCFSVHIKYVAVEKDYQGKRIGTFVLQHIMKSVMEMCVTWPIRLITLEALKEKYDWYWERGFRPFNEEDMDNDDSTIWMFCDCMLNRRTFDNYIDQQ